MQDEEGSQIGGWRAGCRKSRVVPHYRTTFYPPPTPPPLLPKPLKEPILPHSLATKEGTRNVGQPRLSRQVEVRLGARYGYPSRMERGDWSIRIWFVPSNETRGEGRQTVGHLAPVFRNREDWTRLIESPRRLDLRTSPLDGWIDRLMIGRERFVRRKSNGTKEETFFDDFCEKRK